MQQSDEKPRMSADSPKIRFRDSQIEMAHGAGGKASRRLVEGLFAPLLFGTSPEPLGDAAHLNVNGTRIAITTDSFVVKPLTFPGGSIGELAVNGTVNDLAVSGAKAEALVVTYVLEAGLPTQILEAASPGHEQSRECCRRNHFRRRYKSCRTRQSGWHVCHNRRHRQTDSRHHDFACLGSPRR